MQRHDGGINVPRNNHGREARTAGKSSPVGRAVRRAMRAVRVDDTGRFAIFQGGQANLHSRHIILEGKGHIGQHACS